MQGPRSAAVDEVPPPPDSMPNLSPDVGVDLPPEPTALDASLTQ